MQAATAEVTETSKRKAYTYGDGSRMQIDERGDRVMESKTRELESQFHRECVY